MTPGVFLALGIIGLVLLGVSALLGDDIEVDPGFDADFEPDVETDGDSGGSILDWFSVKAIAAGLVGFGFAGWALGQIGVVGAIVWVLSTMCGLVLWTLVVLWLLPWLKSQEGDDLKSIQTLVGLTGTVVVAIQPDEVGTIQLTDRSGTVTRVNASSLKGKGVKEGSEVLVVTVDSDRVIVDEFSI